jgi:peptidoglycan hydrolase-like protein with peptidoglycan-binding domain
MAVKQEAGTPIAAPSNHLQGDVMVSGKTKSALLAAAVMLVTPVAAIAVDALTSLHPEEAYPDNTRQVSPDRYTDLTKSVQRKLHELGFNAGPVNGEFDSKTQAALAQFQLSRTLPVSGMLDDRTLGELGIERDAQASAGASADATPLK